jgi:ADP-ribose pyrophosphatase
MADEAEDIRVTAMSADEAVVRMQDGTIISAAPIIALQWLVLHRESLRERWLSSTP